MSDNRTVEARIRLRTKNSGPLTDPSELYSTEIVYDNNDNGIAVKGFDDDDSIYKFIPVSDDVENVSENRSWSGEYTLGIIGEALQQANSYTDGAISSLRQELEGYVDEQISLSKKTTISLPSASLFPKNDSSACAWSTSFNTLGTGAPQYLYNMNSTQFYQDKIGYWNVIIPGDYNGLMKTASICISNTSGSSISSVSFRLTANVFPAGPYNIVTGQNPESSNYIDFSGISLSNNNLTTILSDVSTNSLFGASSNINKICVMELKLTSVTASDKPVNFHYIKLQY